MLEGGCTPPTSCSCIGHKFPGVTHMVACCDKPHITVEEFEDENFEESIFKMIPMTSEPEPNEIDYVNMIESQDPHIRGEN